MKNPYLELKLLLLGGTKGNMEVISFILVLFSFLQGSQGLRLMEPILKSISRQGKLLRLEDMILHMKNLLLSKQRVSKHGLLLSFKSKETAAIIGQRVQKKSFIKGKINLSLRSMCFLPGKRIYI